MSWRVPTLADAEEYVRRLEMNKLAWRMEHDEREALLARYLASEEYADIVERMELREKLQAEDRRKAELKERRRKIEAAVRAEADRLERQRRADERRLKLYGAPHSVIEAYNDRERRSRVRWEGLIEDRDVVKRQMAFERTATAIAMRAVGMSFREIGRQLGVCGARAQQIVVQGERKRRRPNYRSPAENYLAEQTIEAVTPRMAFRLNRALDDLTRPPHDPEADWIWMGLAA